ncbi:acyltransferase family protein [Pseudonocardia sp. CA-107938]|uniref:acyltransferase family protein n=1 Tax=Pseudonocardia sp. CA-107938 TaxID=3240021 RepID=UPI003D8DE0B7
MTIRNPRSTAAGDASGAGELRGLTGLRIVAAAWVVLFHFHFTPLPGLAEVIGVLGPLITSGALGVDLFFVLSGFVIAHTYLDRLGPSLQLGPTARFVWARACRIWPAYVLVFNLFGIWLVARLVFGHDGDIAFQAVQPEVNLGQWVAQMFMVQLWDQPMFDGASWVGPTWSISAEWLAYLLFPVAALVFFRLRRLPAPVLMLGALALMAPMTWAYLRTGNPYFEWSWLVRILCGFGAGVLTNLAVRRLRGGSAINRRASVAAALLPVLIVGGLFVGDEYGEGRGGAVMALFPLLVGALALADRGPAVLLSSRPAVYGGYLSYALYLVHIPMFEVYWLAQRYVPWLAGDSLAADLVAAGVVLATLPVAAAIYRLVEEPSRRQLRRLARPERPVVVLPEARRPVPSVVVPPVVVPAQGHDPVAAVTARRAASRHAASPHRQSTLAAALVKAQRRRPAHRAQLAEDLDRAAFIRDRYLEAGE